MQAENSLPARTWNLFLFHIQIFILCTHTLLEVTGALSCYLQTDLLWKHLWDVQLSLMGVCHPSSEGVPGGPSADEQRRRMAGCGARGSSVSRLYPSIPQTFPAERPARYSIVYFSLTLFLSLPLFSYLSLFSLLCLVPLACRAWVINWLHCESETLSSRSSSSVLIHPENSKLSYYNHLVHCLKMESLPLLPLSAFWLLLHSSLSDSHEFASAACVSFIILCFLPVKKKLFPCCNLGYTEMFC